MKFRSLLFTSLLCFSTLCPAQDPIKLQKIQKEWVEAGFHHSLEKGMLRYVIAHQATEDIPLHLKPNIGRQIRGFTRFHQEYWQLANLSKDTKHLKIEKKSFDSMPKIIRSFSQLESLSLAQNQLWQIPLELQYLKQLKILDLSDNLIEQIPEYLSGLTTLQTLNLYHNKLSGFIPHTLSEENLQSLNLAHNQLQNIPDDIDKFKNLKTLNLAWNQLITLPESILHLPALEELHLEGNPRLSLPQEMFQQLKAKLKFFYYDESLVKKIEKRAASL
jgi:Leucine-rich repeat (LRR) protein